MSSDHVIGGPLALASSEFAPQAWTKFKDLPALRTPAVTVIQGTATRVDSEKKVVTIVNKKIDKEYEESYDYLIAASGLRRAWPVVPQSLTREEYLPEALDHGNAVANARECVVVIGGGKFLDSLHRLA
jgi:NADPH-dependent 2,4-dienoyl-CoA reductase/sulfur reductase-like enzyme